MKKILIVLVVLTMFLIYNEVKEKPIIIPDTAIRLRVIPNSNTSLDQNMKNQVKKYLEQDTYKKLENINNINDARKIINNNLDNIDKSINNIFKKNNYNMDYNINFGYNYFPEKEYKQVKYKEGYYESIVITIGDGKGDNWWCVLFPPLCLLDNENQDEVEYKFLVKELLDKIF